MDDLGKFVSELAQKFPDPDDFIKEIDKTDKPEKEKGYYFIEIGNQLFQISNFKLSLKVWHKALEYFVKFNDKKGEAKCCGNTGVAYMFLGEIQKAIEYQNKSLELFKASSDKAGESNCYNNLGIAFKSLGNFHKAIECYNKSLEIFKVVGDKTGEAKCGINLGSVFMDLGDFRKGIEYFEKALEVFKTIGDKVNESRCYNGLGIAYGRLGYYQKALEYYDKSLEIAKAIGDRNGESSVFNNLASVYKDLGNQNKSINYFNKALEIKKAIGDKVGEANCFGNLGLAYGHLGDFYKAIEFHNKSLEIVQAIKNRAGESDCFSHLGIAYGNLGEFNKAIEYLNKSLELTKSIGKKPREASCYNNLGIVFWKLGDYQKAREYYDKSLEIIKIIQDKAGEAECYYNIGNIYLSLNNFEEGIKYFKKALEIAESIKNVYHKKKYLDGFGNTYINQKNFKKAEGYYKQSIEILENMRRENIPNEYKRSFWKDNIPIFDNLIISDVKLGKKEEALENSERGKGRIIFDYILGRGLEEKDFKPEPLKFIEIQELAKRTGKNIVLLRVTEKGTFTFIVKSRLKEEVKFELLEFPEFTTERLEELTVKLEEGKPTGGWVHAYSNYKSVTDRIKPLLLEEKVVEAGKLLKQEEEKWFKTMDVTLKVLYDEMMGKLFGQFKKGEKVVLIPNRALNILPLHACFHEENGKKHYLLEDYEISYAPNCNILDLCEKREKGERRRKHDFFAIANPAPPYNLAFSEWEVEEIGKLFDTKEVYIKEEVKDKLLDKIADYGVIHLSTHGIYDLGSSFNSRLRLGKETDLTLEEIFEKVRIDNSWLVSLSACESGLVDYRDIADEYIGLQTGFLYAGAPTVIASLWSVADFTTAFIMIKAYGYIFKDGLRKSEALRKAQLWLKDLTAGEALSILAEKELELEYSIKMAAGDLMPLRISIKSEDPESKPFAHPYYWAGFQLFGAWENMRYIFSSLLRIKSWKIHN